jgi:hypothetical protein
VHDGTELTANDETQWSRGRLVTDDESGGSGKGRNALSGAREWQHQGGIDISTSHIIQSTGSAKDAKDVLRKSAGVCIVSKDQKWWRVNRLVNYP